LRPLKNGVLLKEVGWESNALLLVIPGVDMAMTLFLKIPKNTNTKKGTPLARIPFVFLNYLLCL
jgi:hypothetical protein